MTVSSITPDRIGTYPIERELGRGGMGVVYLARDTRLDRLIAIKVLTEAFAHDPERLARFEREAKILASLNHANIAGIYGLEEADGQRFLTLQYVEGDTLGQRIARHPMPVEEALEICRQIALAVEAAHENGVIHRDLKPSNVKIAPDGQVKVLDFGLAKGGTTATASGSDPDLSHSPTLTYAATATGVILGTAAYMSPEQARGKALDKRTDIWSFGCILYECLTGKQAFAGETVSDTIAMILQGEPDWAALPAQVPGKVRELIRHCLEKDAKRRIRDIGDARIELEDALASRTASGRIAMAGVPEAARPALTPATIGLAAGLLLAGALVGVGLWNTVGPGGRSAAKAGAFHRVARLSIPMPPELRVQTARLSPDGSIMALLATPRLKEGAEQPVAKIYIRRLDQYDVKPITGSDGALGFGFSTDGRWIAFVAPISKETIQKKLFKVPVDGGSPPVAITDWDDAWSAPMRLADGDFLVSTDRGTKFFRLPADGSAPKPAIKFDAGSFAGTFGPVNALPRDRAVFVNATSYGSRGYQIGVGLLDPKTGKVRILFDEGGNANYSPTGHIIFTRGDALMAAPFDLNRLKVNGQAVALFGGLRTANTWAHGAFDVSNDGTLMYAPGGRVGGQRRISIVDAAGNITPWSGERRAFEISPELSRDGRRVASVITSAKGIYETWVSDRERPTFRRLASLPDADCLTAVWSPDGQQIAYARQARKEQDGIYVLRADGSGQPRRVLKPDSPSDDVNPTTWSPDGSTLLYSKTSAGKTDMLLLAIPPPGEPLAKPKPLLASSFNEFDATFSPDGKWIAYDSDESGKFEVYVCAYQPGGTVGGGVMVSSGGGQRPRWSADGKRLIYVADQGRVMSVTITTQPALSASPPTLAYDLNKLRVNDRDFDLLPDGRLIVTQKGEEEDEITRFDLVLNWVTELRERLSRTEHTR